MKIIEGLKKVKELQRKSEDLRKKISEHSANLSYETPVYKDQETQVKEWLQAHEDISQEILGLRLAIQKTNLETSVTIELGNKSITKSIAGWIHRRKDLAKNDAAAWRNLTDKNLQDAKVKQSNGEILDVKIIRYYDPRFRDLKISLYDSEPSIIDGKLEVVNAVTELI